MHNFLAEEPIYERSHDAAQSTNVADSGIPNLLDLGTLNGLLDVGATPDPLKLGYYAVHREGTLSSAINDSVRFLFLISPFINLTIEYYVFRLTVV